MIWAMEVIFKIPPISYKLKGLLMKIGIYWKLDYSIIFLWKMLKYDLKTIFVGAMASLAHGTTGHPKGVQTLIKFMLVQALTYITLVLTNKSWVSLC